MSWLLVPVIESLPGPPTNVTDRFEWFTSVSLPVPPSIVMDGMVELTEESIVTVSFPSPALIVIGPVRLETRPQSRPLSPSGQVAVACDACGVGDRQVTADDGQP